MNLTNHRQFSMGQVLTVITGRFVCEKEGIGGVYEILNFMTGDDIFTHQIPRALNECEPYLQKQFPALSVFADRIKKETDWRAVLAEAECQISAFLEVQSLPLGAHKIMEPLSELKQIKGDKATIITIGEGDPDN